MEYFLRILDRVNIMWFVFKRIIFVLWRIDGKDVRGWRVGFGRLN